MTRENVAIAGSTDSSAMDTLHPRGSIQEEILNFEHHKHHGSLPLIGDHSILPKEHGGDIVTEIELIRSTEAEECQQIDNVLAYGESRYGHATEGLKPLQHAPRKRENCFTALIEAVKKHSLGHTASSSPTRL